MTNEAEIIERGIIELGASVSREQVASLLSYLTILETTNQSFNLTRIPRSDYATLHILDSLTALIIIPNKSALRILDIGTGAGFPGVPLACVLPHAQVTLLDSTAKKVRFAADTAHHCGIRNCLGIHARAETLAKDPEHRARYDVVISRAVASFDRLVRLMMPLVAPGGIALALKGAKAEEELVGTDVLVRSLGGAPAQIHTVTIPGSDIVRNLIVVQKH